MFGAFIVRSHIPLHRYLDYVHFSTAQKSFLVGLSSDIEPTSFAKARKFAHQTDAMASEIQALESNNAWAFTHLLPGKNAVIYKCVLKFKRRFGGSIEL